MNFLLSLGRIQLHLASAVVNALIGIFVLLTLHAFSPIDPPPDSTAPFLVLLLVIGIFVPFYETWILVTCLERARAHIKRRNLLAVTAGLCCGGLHYFNSWQSAVIVTLPFIFQCYLYCAGRDHGFDTRYAMRLLWFVHSFNNISVYSIGHLVDHFFP